MSRCFIRCSLCGLPHEADQATCPVTGWVIPRGGKKNPLIGKKLDQKYIVKGVLGEGGMATVLEAEQISIGRSVAVKVLNAKHSAKPTAVKRFQNEARAAGTIGHPNICEIYDLGVLEDERPYLVMEKLRGESLAARIGRDGMAGVDDAFEFLIQVLSGLFSAHELGILHRDIKPENIFLTSRMGCPAIAKILDFGVSKVLLPGDGAEEDLTLAGTIVGTPFYMAPEQIRGERDLDARVDVYACGVVLYEMLTGRRPYEAKNFLELADKVEREDWAPIESFRTVPKKLSKVVRTAMAGDRDKRYPSAAVFQRDLLLLRDEVRTRPEEYGFSGTRRHRMTVSSSSTDIPISIGPPSSSVDSDATEIGHVPMFEHDGTPARKTERPFRPAEDDRARRREAKTVTLSPPEEESSVRESNFPYEATTENRIATETPPQGKRRGGRR